MTEILKKNLTLEEQTAIRELLAKIAKQESTESIEEWVRSHPENIQVLLVQTVHESIKSIDLLLSQVHPDLKPFIDKIIQEN